MLVFVMVAGAVTAALGVVFFTLLTIKYRDEDIAFPLGMAAFMCLMGALGGFHEAAKAADEGKVREQAVPVDAKPR